MTDTITKLRRILDGLEVASLSVIADRDRMPAADNHQDRTVVAAALGELNILCGAERSRADVNSDELTVARCDELFDDLQRVIERQNDAFGIG